MSTSGALVESEPGLGEAGVHLTLIVPYGEGDESSRLQLGITVRGVRVLCATAQAGERCHYGVQFDACDERTRLTLYGCVCEQGVAQSATALVA